MAARHRTSANVTRAARRNIRRAQLYRFRRRETRSLGRELRKREQYSRPASSRLYTASKARGARRA